MCTSSDNTYVIYTTDPINQIVFLTRERWDNHITYDQYGEAHIEMIGEEEAVQEAVEDPDAIYSDKYHPGIQNYIYKHNSSTLKLHGQYLKVVVSRDLMGSIITAYPVPSGKQYTKPIYLKGEHDT